jgi:hypothetical protein
MRSDDGSRGPTEYKVLTARRLKACSELLDAVVGWLGEVGPSAQGPWLLQRQTELVLRSIQSMHGCTLLAGRGLWMPTYALARMLIEDAAVAHWLAVHPKLDVLQARWRRHLLATHLSDIETQEKLGLGLDAQTIRWHSEQDAAEFACITDPAKLARVHWTGKSSEKLAAGAAARAAPSRLDWDARALALAKATTRFAPLASLGIHHSPSSSQNWYAPASEMLPDALRFAWRAFSLHAILALEELAPAHLDGLARLIEDQATEFSQPPVAGHLADDSAAADSVMSIPVGSTLRRRP